MILYKGDLNAVKKQIDCEHKWNDISIDSIAKNRKCIKCHCIDYDLKNFKEYLKIVKYVKAVKDLKQNFGTLTKDG